MTPRPGLPRGLLLTGLAGSVLVAVGGAGAGALPRPSPGSWAGVGALAQTPTTRSVSAAVVAAGVLLLCAAWWRTRPLLDDLATGAVARAAALWSLPLLIGPPLFSRDVYAYAGQASVALRGLDPYEVGPGSAGGVWAEQVDDVWRGTPSPYGPAWVWPAAQVLRLTGDHVGAGVLALRALAVLGVLLTGWAVVRLAARCGVPGARALWLAVLNPLLLLHGVAGAHNDVLMVGLVLAALAVGLREPRPTWLRAAAAGALVVAGGLVKAPALAGLPVVVLAVAGWRSRAVVASGVAVGAAAVAAAVPVVTGLGWGWVSTVDTGRTLLSLFSPATGLGTLLGAAAESAGLASDVDAVREPVLAVLAAAAVLAAGALLLLTPRLGPVRALGLALLAVTLLSPTVLPWYLLWAALPLAAVAGRRTAAALGAACLVLCLLTWPSGRSVVRPPLYGVPLVLAGAAPLVAARREPAGDRAGAANS